jgi:anti-sigma B factor antagonist
LTQSTPAQRASTDGSFSISSLRLERGILVALSGDVDLATATIAEDELQRAEQSEDLVVLDLGEVSFMDSTGLRMVISAHERLRKRGASLEIRRVPPQVARLFELVGVNDHLGVGEEASLEGAGSSDDRGSADGAVAPGDAALS